MQFRYLLQVLSVGLVALVLIACGSAPSADTEQPDASAKPTASASPDHVEGLRVMFLAPAAAPPPDSYWLPVASGLVAPGSTVYILRGAF